MYLAECVCINATSNFSCKKYKQIHTIQTHSYKYKHDIHTKIHTLYIQNKSVTMCMYAYVCACMCLYCVCMYVLLHYFGCKHVSECMCMYLYVSIHCHCSPVFIRERLGYIEYLKLQSTLEKAFLFEILFYFSKGHSRVVRGPHHGPRVDVVQAAA